jgi:hypothetical protein
MKCPFFYWKKHEYQFPIVGFLTRQNFKILTNHIEIEHIFANASVLIILRHYQLRFDNLDVLVTIYKTLPDDVCTNCPFIKEDVLPTKHEKELWEQDYFENG